MAESKSSMYRVVFITAAATAGVVVLAMLIFLFSSRESGAPTLAEEGVAPAAEAPARIPTRVEYRDDLPFFSPTSGDAAIWYYKRPDGDYDLFDAPGYHPTYGREAPLQPVTPLIVGDIQASFKEPEPVRASAPRPAAPRPSPAPRAAAAAPRAADPAPATVRSVTIPAGTRLEVVLDRQLSTETNRVGDSFPVSLTRAVVIDGATVLAEGASLIGEITALERPGRVSGVAKMTLVLKTAEASAIDTVPLTLEGQSTKSEDAVKVGIGAGIGAAVGAIFGGGDGAARGTAIGAGGGAGTVLATRGEDLVLPPEQQLTFTLATNATIH